MTEHRTDRLWRRLGWVRPVALLVTLGTVTSATMAAGLEAQGWYNPAWQYRKAITIDGAQVVGNLSAFPVLISLTDADLSARALANGFDILFTDADGTSKLDHERTRWVSGTGELIAWVKVTSLTAGVDKTIYMYYGNGGAADQQNAASVWSNGYEAVYHLDDDFADATGNHTPGTNNNSVDVPALIGDGQDFEQANNTDHIDIGNWSVAGSQLTIQSWVRYESFAINDARIVSKALDAAEQEHVFMLSNINVGSPTNWRMRLKTGTLDASGTTTLIQPTNTVNVNTWYLTAATYDGATMRLLQNGGQVASVGKTGNLRQNGWSIYLGNNPRNGTTPWYKALDGILDEVRISSSVRSSSWLTTEYNNQRPGATFYSVGPEQTPACPPASLPFVDGFNRPNSSTVGNCWTETQMVGDDSRINNNRLQFVTTDLANSPIVFRDFTAVGAGLLRWSYVFNWDRTGAENFYQLWMQLGNSALMVDPNVSNNAGVAVNLKWAGPNHGMINHEGFGYVQGASTTEVAVVSGGPGNDHTIEVIANLNSSTFSLRIDGVLQASGIAFDNSVPIDAVRLYADVVNAPNFGTREFDDVAIGFVSYGVSVAPDGPDTLQQLPTNGSSYSYTFTVTNNSTAIEDFDLFGLPGDTVVAVDSITGASVTQGAPPDSARLAGLTGGNSDNAVVWFSVVNAASGSLDSLYLGGRSVNDASATDSGWVFVRVVKPNITTVKAVDPSGTVAPGTDLTYTLTVTNEGEYDAVGVEILDSLAVEVDFQVGSVVNNLPAGISVVVEYSNDGGSSWTYIPLSAGCGAGAGYDGCVTRVRWTLQDDLSYLAPDNTGNVQFAARIK